MSQCLLWCMWGLDPTLWRGAFLADLRGKNLQPHFKSPSRKVQNPLRRGYLFAVSVSYCFPIVYNRVKNLQPSLRRFIFVILCGIVGYGIFLLIFCTFDRFPLPTIKYVLGFKDREGTSCRQHNMYSKVSRIELPKILLWPI